jgi:hypothetical protein
VIVFLRWGCGNPEQERFLSAPAIELKTGGGGWIVDPLLDVTMREDLTSDPFGRTDVPAHLFRRHAAFESGEPLSWRLLALLGEGIESRDSSPERR